MNDKFKDIYRIESARLKNWDYRSNAAYFVTICTVKREHFFGEINDRVMCLSDIGIIADNFCREIPNHFQFVTVDEFVIMPNHVHCIIVIDRPTIESVLVETLVPVETLHATSLQEPISVKSSMPVSPKPGSLSTIIRSYKSIVTKHARRIRFDFAWQTRFYDHVIRDDESFDNICNYIKNNPINWADDEFNK